METLISSGFIIPQSPPQKLILFYNNRVQNYCNFSHQKWQFHTHKTVTLCSITASDSLSYGGWDDFRLGGDSVQSGESNQMSNFMNYIGLNDKKYVFVYLLGFVCALAISRVKVSSIIVIPACAVVFAVGFSIGFVNNRLSLIGFEKRSNFDDRIDIILDKMNNLMGFFSGFDGQVSEIKNDIRRCLKDNRINVDDLERYVKSTELIGSLALNAKYIVQECIDMMLLENQEVEQTVKQNSNKRKKGTSGKRFDLLQFMVGMFQEKSISPKVNNIKDISKESVDMELDDDRRASILVPSVEEMRRRSISNGDVVNGRARSFRENPSMTESGIKQSSNGTRKSKVISENEIMDMLDFVTGAGRVSESKKYDNENNRARFTVNEKTSRKMGQRDNAKAYASDNDMFDSNFIVNHGIHTNSSPRKEPEKMKSNEYYMHSGSNDQISEGRCGTNIREEVKFEDASHTSARSAQGSDFASSPSSKVTDDMLFNRYLMEANALLKRARETLKNKSDEGDVENALQETAFLLLKAIELKPMSLLAMGQLGNTYLLHGELKLKVSRELRAQLWRSNESLLEEDYYCRGLDAQFCNKEELASVLINVCQECEELLVEAGRKYRSALSIDGDDMRALYNWGLALSFRAQLIADIGPEAALDADKVFLAAIDKFNAMMSKSNTHAPDALFRWGVALQQRARLRKRNYREKVKLLHQAKRLYEDALDMDSDNLQVRKALVSCITEMNYRA